MFHDILFYRKYNQTKTVSSKKRLFFYVLYLYYQEENGNYITDRSLSNYLSDSVSNYTEPGWKYTQIAWSIIESSHENIILEMNDIE